MPSIKNILRVCLYCQRDFLAKKSAINAGYAKFCSLSCSISYRNKSTKMSSEEIFWRNTNKRYGDCWIYSACISSAGYGRICIDRKFIQTHRFSYELHYGPIPKDMFVCHKCDNPPCVNPSHLFLGSCADNNLDKSLKNRDPKGMNHWNNKLTESNVLEIKESLKDGVSGIKLSHIYCVHPQTIYAIKYNFNWKWLHNE